MPVDIDKLFNFFDSAQNKSGQEMRGGFIGQKYPIHLGLQIFFLFDVISIFFQSDLETLNLYHCPFFISNIPLCLIKVH